MKITPIRVSKNFLHPTKMRRAVDNFLKAGSENIRIEFGVVTQTWRNKPKFLIEIINQNERAIYTKSTVKGKPIFKFVSGGTRVRYATMSRDWVSKTQPNVLGSGPGAGRMLYVSKKHPHPGIKPRNFPHIIIQKWQPRLANLFIRMITDELTRNR